MFERLGVILGTSAGGKTAAVLITAGLFGLAHYYPQGLAGVIQSTAVGLVFGAIFSLRRPLWTLMIAHITFDLVALITIYLGWEEILAHLFLR